MGQLGERVPARNGQQLPALQRERRVQGGRLTHRQTEDRPGHELEPEVSQTGHPAALLRRGRRTRQDLGVEDQNGQEWRQLVEQRNAEPRSGRRDGRRRRQELDDRREGSHDLRAQVDQVGAGPGLDRLGLTLFIQYG